MAPQLLPVEKAVNAASTKIVAGSAEAGRLSPRLAIRKSAVCNSRLISDIDQASTRIIIAMNVNRAPDTQASTISSSVNSPCRAVMTTAVNAESKDAHMSAWYELAEPMMSLMVSPSPVIYRPARMPMIMTITGIRALMAFGWTPSFMASAASSSCPTVDVTGGTVTPVARARCSAARIGPNSRPVVITSTMRKMAMKG